jgi:hypothetical protein
MLKNRIYETQNLLSVLIVSFLVGLRTYQHPCTVYVHTHNQRKFFELLLRQQVWLNVSQHQAFSFKNFQ